MIYTRTLTQGDLKLLGSDPLITLSKIIDHALCVDPDTVQSRILLLMSQDQAMNARQITDVHNVMFADHVITIKYVRVVINGMFKMGLIKRLSRGRYVK